MAILAGNAGSFKFGETSVAEVTKWSLKVTPIIAERHLLGNAAPSRDWIGQDWTVDIEGMYDETDTGGQDEIYTGINDGTAITDMKLYTSADDYFSSSSAVVTDFSVETAADGAVSFSATISANGSAVTRTIE